MMVSTYHEYSLDQEAIKQEMGAWKKDLPTILLTGNYRPSTDRIRSMIEDEPSPGRRASTRISMFRDARSLSRSRSRRGGGYWRTLETGSKSKGGVVDGTTQGSYFRFWRLPIVKGKFDRHLSKFDSNYLGNWSNLRLLLGNFRQIPRYFDQITLAIWSNHHRFFHKIIGRGLFMKQQQNLRIHKHKFILLG